MTFTCVCVTDKNADTRKYVLARGFRLPEPSEEDDPTPLHELDTITCYLRHVHMPDIFATRYSQEIQPGMSGGEWGDVRCATGACRAARME